MRVREVIPSLGVEIVRLGGTSHIFLRTLSVGLKWKLIVTWALVVSKSVMSVASLLLSYIKIEGFSLWAVRVKSDNVWGLLPNAAGSEAAAAPVSTQLLCEGKASSRWSSEAGFEAGFVLGRGALSYRVPPSQLEAAKSQIRSQQGGGTSRFLQQPTAGQRGWTLRPHSKLNFRMRLSKQCGSTHICGRRSKIFKLSSFQYMGF